MKEEELIKKLESTELPEIELGSHRSALKMALLKHGYSEKKEEVTFLEDVRVRPKGAFDAITGVLTAHRPVWKVALTSALAVVIILTAWLSIPQASAILKSTFFPEGTRTITGPQLTAEEHKKALDILMDDSGVKQLLAQGAVIDTILPIQVGSEIVNPETGNTEIVYETWAQAWLVKGSNDWGVQVDLVRSKVVSITPSETTK